MTGTMQRPVPIPFYQALASVTASGKTVILADAVAKSIAPLPVSPVVLWLSKGRVVVSQTYANLQDGGKYRHLIQDFTIRLLSEYDAEDVADPDVPLIYFATVGTFNQRDREKGDRLIFRSDIDTAEESTWEALKRRETTDGTRRPLLVVYDEGHNLSDQQTNLLLELEPDALFVASATMRLTAALTTIVNSLEQRGWSQEELKTTVLSSDVVAAGLIKRDIVMGGYQAAAPKTIDDMLTSMETADEAAKKEGLSFRPKAIYVSKTNIVEGNSFVRDDPKRPFKQREAPPILIWRYLVEEKGIDPRTIVAYCTLAFDKNYPPPETFQLLKGGDADYDKFIAGNFRHVIFNQSLQEGWDDPACYFAYIDKSMGSNVQVEQVIGRLLRQPDAKHYPDDVLNTASFFVRVDGRGVFADLVGDVRSRLAVDAPSVGFTTYSGGSKERPVPYDPKEAKTVPALVLDAAEALPAVEKIIDEMTDYREDNGANIRAQGERALVQQRIGSGDSAEVAWVPYEHNNAVSARWIFTLAVGRQYPAALGVARSDDPKFDAKVELSSNAARHIEKTADEVVTTYLDRVNLLQRNHNPYEVGTAMVRPDEATSYEYALHQAYSGLNPFEREFAAALDNGRVTWCRNPSQSGYRIPLPTRGSSRNFFPDFLAWKGTHVFALDTTGDHLLLEKTARKLLVPNTAGKKLRVHVRLISKGEWNADVERVSRSGVTVWQLAADRSLRAVACATIADALKLCLKP